jgi:membrane fusion protein
MNGLFRAEALQAVQQQWLGRVQIAQPPALRWSAVLALAVALALGAWLGLASYTRKASVPGALVPDHGLIRLAPVAAGTVLERHVAEGQTVRAGDLLFVLAQDRFSRDDATQGVLDRAVETQRRSLEDVARQQQALSLARDRALALRVEALRAEQLQLAAEAALQQRRLALARQSLERLQSLQAQAFVSEAQVQARQEEVLALEAQGQALQRQQAALGRERAELDGERATLPAQRDSAVAQVGSELAELSRDGAELRGVRRIEVRAPQDGTVHGLLAEPGQSIAPPAALASLLPAGAALQAELLAPGHTMGFVRAGQTVRLRVEAYPYARYGVLTGRVARIDRVPLAAAELGGLALATQAAAGEPLFRLIVTLDPLPPDWRERQLAAGLRLQADVLLERRRLWQWLLEPLLGLQQRL